MKKILIVEDVEFNIDLLVQLLEDRFELVTAMDGAAGIELAARERPDLILMDVVMPGVNGYQATRTLTRDPQTSEIPIVMISSKNLETDKIWGMRQGAADYLTKPVTEADLLAKAKELLDRVEE